MIRLLQLSMIIAALLVARYFLYRWLGARDSLRVIVRDAVNVLLGYFVYVTAGMLIFSWLSGTDMAQGNRLVSALLTVFGALYVGGGVWLVWMLLARQERGTRRR